METTQHTPGHWEVTEDGEANFFGISTKNNWLMRIQQNGELNVETQKANIQLLASAPELLKEKEKYFKAFMDEAQKTAFQGIEIDRLRALNAELLEALKLIINCTPEPGEDAILTATGYNKACAAIQKASKV